MNRRIAIVCKSYPAVGPKFSARTAWIWAKALVQLGVSVEIVTAGVNQEESAYRWETVSDADGILVTRVSAGTVVTPRQAQWRALLARGPFDAVFVTRPGVFGQPALMAAAEWHVPSLVHVDGQDMLTDGFDPLWAPFLDWCLGQATVVTAATPQMAVMARVHRLAEEVTVWPDVHLPQSPVTADRTEAEAHGGLKPTAHRIGTWNATAESGGLNDVLAAFGLVRRALPQAQLLLAGEVPETVQKQLEAWRTYDPLSAAAMCLVPPMAEGDKARYLAAVDQIWLTPRLAGAHDGLVAAMAAGVPAVATPGGLASAWLADGAGLLVNPGDPYALASAALRYAHDPVWAKDVGLRARTALPVEATFENLGSRLSRQLAAWGLAV